MLKEFLSKIKHQEQQVVINLGPVDVKVEDKQAIPWLPLQFTEANLRIARENGVKPLSLEEILAQIKPEEINKIILFDTPPVQGFIGNHWRITKIDQEKKSATLRLCGIFGNHDYDQALPVNVPLNTIMFTGISIQRFRLDGKPVNLNQVVSAVKTAYKKNNNYPEFLTHHGETILWSDSKGNLKK